MRMQFRICLSSILAMLITVPSGKYWNILVYDRELSEEEIREYELDRIQGGCKAAL